MWCWTQLTRGRSSKKTNFEKLAARMHRRHRHKSSEGRRSPFAPTRRVRTSTLHAVRYELGSARLAWQKGLRCDQTYSTARRKRIMWFLFAALSSPLNHPTQIPPSQGSLTRRCPYTVKRPGSEPTRVFDTARTTLDLFVHTTTAGIRSMSTHKCKIYASDVHGSNMARHWYLV